MAWDVDLAQELKNRNNESRVGIIVGTVVSINPLTISIYNGKGIFTGDNLYICKNASEYNMTVSIVLGDNTYTGTVKHEGLKENDRVAVIATEDNQKLFAIDKLK